MTNKEALQNLTEIFILSCLSAGSREKAENYNKALQIAHEALEKQIPKKPINCDNNGTGYRCYCGETLLGNWKPKYCMFCGQALDWSEKE